MAFYPGKNYSWTWSATSQPSDKADVSFPSEVIDTTNSTSGGYQSNEAGVFASKATNEGPYNGSLGLSQGGSITHTFATGGGGPSFAIPYRLADLRISTAVRNQVARYSIQLESNGSYTVTF